MYDKVTLNTNYHKDCPKSILHSPTISLIQITGEATNSEYLLNVNNIQQKDIKLTWVPWLLLDLSLAVDSLSLVHQ
jgi:hypothetical protein